MKLIAIYNNKGGVGKTTSVINIAHALASSSKSILVVDCDGQGNSSRFFADNAVANGIERCFTVSATEPTACMQHTRYPNVDIIPATAKMNAVISDFEALPAERRKENVAKLRKCEEYDFVIIDLPPALNILTQEIIKACDYAFVPIELNTFAIQGVANVTEIIASCGTQLGGVFVTKFDRDNPSDVALYDLLRENLGRKLMKTLLPYSRVIKNSITYRTTAAEYMEWTDAAQAYKDLATEITKICE